MKRKYMLKKIISLIFALTLIAMLATTAVAMETRASKLIISHSCVASADADGEINVTFSITGKGIMSRIGAQSIRLEVCKKLDIKKNVIAFRGGCVLFYCPKTRKEPLP